MSDYKIICQDKEARDAIRKGSQKLADAVVSTYGPKSRNVAINAYPAPRILHDGVSVARAFFLKDTFEDMGAQMIKEAATKTNDGAGDGTTTAILLANTLVQKGMDLIDGGTDNDGVMQVKQNPMTIRRELATAAKDIVAALQKKLVKIVTPEEFAHVATISAADPVIGKMVADAIFQVGVDGVVMLERSESYDSYVEYKKGYEFDNGYLDKGFSTDPNREVVEYKDGYVLVTDYHIENAEALLNVVTDCMTEDKPLLIIADDVTGPALTALVMTKKSIKTRAKVVAVAAPEYGERRAQMLEDIAILTGGVLISKAAGKKLEDVKISDLGRVSNIEVSDSYTKLVPSFPDEEEIKERVKVIKEQITKSQSPVKTQSLQMRLGKLSQNVAIFYYGAASNNEAGDLKERVQDAIYATKAAISDGVLPGGGVALKDVASELYGEKQKPTPIQEMIFLTLWTPIETLAANSGIDLTGTDLFDTGIGMNVETGERIDVMKKDIIDPFKVTKLAVLHAFSTAGTAITTATLISDDLDADRGVQKVRAV